MINKIKDLLKGQLALLLAGRKVNKKIWIFSSTDNKEFNYNSRALFLYVYHNLPEITPKYVINDEKKRIELINQYGDCFCETKSLHGMIQVCRSGVWFTSAGMPVYAVGSGKHHTIINLWHGVPLKKIALMEANVSKFKRIYFKKIFSDNYSAIVTTSKTLVPIMAKSFAVSEQCIKIWGQPRNDHLNELRLKGSRLLGQPGWMKSIPQSKAILYAPTYREYSDTTWFPFADWNRELFLLFLEENNLVLYMRTHLQESGNFGQFLGERIIDLGSEKLEDIAEELPRFDLLITDYSSIYIDYLLLDRPIIFLPYDERKYLERRGMNFDYQEVTPGAKPDTMKAFMNAIIDAFSEDSYQAERDRVNHMLNEVTVPCAKAICESILKEDLSSI